MSSTHDCNTRSKEMSDSKILDEISKLREELVENFKKTFTDIKDEIINLKEVIIKNLQNENKRLNDEVSQLKEKIISIESKSNSVEQYGRRNNMEINGIPNSISDDNLESTVTNVFSKATNIHVTADDIEACHRIGKSKKHSMKTIVHFINRKHCKCALVNRKKQKSFNSESIGLPMLNYILIKLQQNITIHWVGRKLKRAGLINSNYTLNGTVSTFMGLYPNFDFSNNDGDILVDALGNTSIQSSSY